MRAFIPLLNAKQKVRMQKHKIKKQRILTVNSDYLQFDLKKILFYRMNQGNL